jgi:hypothetical protein
MLVLGTVGVVGIAVAWPLMSPTETTRIVAVYPSAAEVPANLLRFYVEFSAPMREDVALDHVRLLDDSGRVVHDAFLALREELWDPSGRRLTLLLDPGRIKRGLRSHQEMGAALAEGRQYRLVVDGAWIDASGRELAGPYEKRFRVGSVDRTRPRPEDWTITAPRFGTRDPLQVQFAKPLDHAQATALLRLLDASGTAIEGGIRLADDDRVWIFTPTRPWSGSDVHIQINTRLEDLAGNSIARAFDVDHRTEEAAAETVPSRPTLLRVQLRDARP